jgi:hypothetical protein
VPEFVRLGSPGLQAVAQVQCVSSRRPIAAVLWLQGITLAWMLAECGVSLYAAATARSPAILAFGSDSLIELFSATVILFQFLPRFPFSQERANLAAGLLLFALAGVVAAVAVVALALRAHLAASQLGIGITIAALIAMPILARLKIAKPLEATIPRSGPMRFSRRLVRT